MKFTLRRLLIFLLVSGLIIFLLVQPTRTARKFSELVEAGEFETVVEMLTSRDSLFHPQLEKPDVANTAIEIQVQPVSIWDMVTMRRNVKTIYRDHGRHTVLYCAGFFRVKEIHRSYRPNDPNGPVHIPW